MKKNVIITGGANGIGFSCVKEFLNNDYNVIVIDKIKCSKINVFDKNIDYYCCDISDEVKVKKCIDKIKAKYKNIDVLINNAGIQVSSSFENYNNKLWKEVVDTNYFGTCNMIFHVSKLMDKDSTILNVLSIHSSKPRINKYAYDCSKSALEMLTKELALEFAKKGITINGISFGAVNTNMNMDWTDNPENKKIVASKVPLNIIFEPEQVAKFCFTIVEEFSRYTTGSIFTIDGGRSLI